MKLDPPASLTLGSRGRIVYYFMFDRLESPPLLNSKIGNQWMSNAIGPQMGQIKRVF